MKFTEKYKPFIDLMVSLCEKRIEPSSDILSKKLLIPKISHLVTYEGGGYDGCFWEVNIGVLCRSKYFIPLYASGYKGVKTQADWERSFKGKHDYFKATSKYSITKSGLLRLSETENLAVIRYISELLLGIWNIEIPFKCCSCQETSDCLEYPMLSTISMLNHNWSQGDLICQDCYVEFVCDECGKVYWKEEEQKELHYVTIDGDIRRLCNSCREALICEVCNENPVVENFYLDPDKNQLTLLPGAYTEIDILTCQECFDKLQGMKGDLTKIYSFIQKGGEYEY